MTAKRGGNKKATKVKREDGSDDAGNVGNVAVETARQLAEIVDAYGLSELKVDSELGTFTLRRGSSAPTQLVHAAPALVHAPAPGVAPAVEAPAAEPSAADEVHVVTSPFVGTFYRSPNPDSGPYVQVGDVVERGAVLCIVEAMKLMNEIEADQGGKIVGVLVENGEPVEFGQPLFRIAPN